MSPPGYNARLRAKQWRRRRPPSSAICSGRRRRRLTTLCGSLMNNCCYASLPTGDGMQQFANYAVNRTSANWQQYDECQYTLSICLLFLLASYTFSTVSFGFRQRRLRQNRKPAAFFRINLTHWSCLCASFRNGRGETFWWGCLPWKLLPTNSIV